MYATHLLAAVLLLTASSVRAQLVDDDTEAVPAQLVDNDTEAPPTIARTGGCRHIDPLPVQPTEETMRRIFRQLTSDHPGKWRLDYEDSEVVAEAVGHWIRRDGLVKAGPRAFKFAKNDANHMACILGHELGHLLNRHHDADAKMWEEEYAAKKEHLMRGAVRLGCNEEHKDKEDGKGGCTRAVERSFQQFMNFENQVYMKLRRDQEDEADRSSLDFVLAGGFEPWACWLLYKKMEPYRGDPSYPNFHRPPQERAKVMAESLTAYAQYSRPCE